MSFASLETHIFVDKFSTTLQLSLHLSRLIMNGKQLSLTGFKLIRIGLAMHKSSFNDTHLVEKVH